MSDAAVRTARVDDADAVGAIQSEVWHAEFAEVLPAQVLAQLVPEQLALVWRRSLTDAPSPLHRVLVATEAEVVVGFVCLVPDDTDPGRAQISELDVRPNSRRRGHGSRLLNAAVDTLRANDVSDVELWLTDTDTRTRAFVEAAGFAADGAWRERVVSAVGDTARQVRLLTSIGGHDDA